MKGPLYRWHCTICGISDAAESSEMARLNIDVHVRMAHPSQREAVRVRPDLSEERTPAGGDDRDDDLGNEPADDDTWSPDGG